MNSLPCCERLFYVLMALRHLVLLKKELEELFPAIQFSKASSLSNFKEIDPNEYDIIFSTIGVKTQKVFVYYF